MAIICDWDLINLAILYQLPNLLTSNRFTEIYCKSTATEFFQNKANE